MSRFKVSWIEHHEMKVFAELERDAVKKALDSLPKKSLLDVKNVKAVRLN